LEKIKKILPNKSEEKLSPKDNTKKTKKINETKNTPTEKIKLN